MEAWIIFIGYFIVYFFLTSRVYLNGHFFLAFFISALIPLGLYWFQTGENKTAIVAVGTIFLFYSLILLFIRVFYKKLNTFFVRHRLVSQVFLNKDFTFVVYGSDGSDDIWDKKRAAPPSWLDHLLSYSLLIFPILGVVCLYEIAGPHLS